MFKILLVGRDFSVNQPLNDVSLIFRSKLKASRIAILECIEIHNEKASGLTKSFPGQGPNSWMGGI
jgi:hypothetical protein